MLPDCTLGVERQPALTFDPSGYPVPGVRQPPTDPLPGRALERADHSWVLALDPALWPVHEGDLVHDPATERAWLVVTADLLHNTYDPVVDYIRVEAEARQGGYTVPPGTNPVGPT